MNNKQLTNKQVKSIVESEGLGYAVQSYMNGSKIKDLELAKMWDECANLLRKIEAYLEI